MAAAGGDGMERIREEVRRRTAAAFLKQFTPEEEKKADELLRRLRSKPDPIYSVQNVLWIVAAMAVFRLTDFAYVVLYDEAVDRPWLLVGSVLLGINVACCLFCVVWLSWIKKIKDDDWDKHYPLVIPVATAAFVLCAFFWLGALWPVWGVLTIPILGIQFMGFAVFIAMIPGIL